MTYQISESLVRAGERWLVVEIASLAEIEFVVETIAEREVVVAAIQTTQ